MKFILMTLLFVAAVTSAKELSVENLNQKTDDIVQFVHDKLQEIPQLDVLLSKLNTHSAFRLSAHLRRNFINTRNNVLKERCLAKLNNCQGSESYRKGVLYACLNSHPHVSEQLEQYKNFVLCNDKLMNDIVASVEQITVNQGKIKMYKANWDKEYQDAEHRDELLDVYDYYAELLNKSKEIIVEHVEKLHGLNNNMHMCMKNGVPEISKRMYDYTEVKGCIDDLLTRKDVSKSNSTTMMP